ncbi:MAG: hypothetical protein EXR11_12055 [Rhodospirillaceae bacterium]|nr:hypothetical protein [Rhodospirillaceae bacterium]
MTIYHLSAGSGGIAHMQELVLANPGNADPLRTSLATSAGATLMTSNLDRTGEWHTTPNIGLTVMLKGWLEIHINRAAPKIFTLLAGDMLFVMDLTGEGHSSRAYGPDGMSALLLPLKASDLASFGQVFKNWPVRP